MKHRRHHTAFIIAATVIAAFIATGSASAQSRATQNTTTQGNPFERRAEGNLLGQRMAAYMTNLKSSLERGLGFSAVQRKKLVERIASDISKLQTETAKLNRAEDSATIQQRIDAIRENWRQISARTRYYVAQILSNHIRFAIERFETIQIKIDVLYVRVPENDERKDEIKKLSDEFAGYLAQARTRFANAQTLIEQIEQAENPQDAFKDAHDALKDSHTNLRKARQTVRTLLQALKQTVPLTEQQTPSTTDTEQP